MVNTKIWLIIFFVAKDGKALYNQQKQDQELTLAQNMNSLLPNSDSNWSRENHETSQIWPKSNPLQLHSEVTNRFKGLDLIDKVPGLSSSFPYFLQFKSESGNKEFMIWATVSFWSCFCWLYRASSSLAANNIINLISVLTIWWCPCEKSSLVLLEEGVCYDQCILLAKLY